MWTAIFQAVAAAFEFGTALFRRTKKTECECDSSTEDAEVDAAAARAGAAAGAAASAAAKKAGKK